MHLSPTAGHTGQNLVSLINGHPDMVLSHVSSRQLEGRKLEGYTKSEVTYSNLSAEKMAEMEEAGEVDAWVMALPNGVCKPFVDAIERAKGGKSVIIDLGADYRFEEGWTYGLPGAFVLASSLLPLSRPENSSMLNRSSVQSAHRALLARKASLGQANRQPGLLCNLDPAPDCPSSAPPRSHEPADGCRL